jgi:2-epi-5-epi-valiolone 7-phosphate 2-epimerase
MTDIRKKIRIGVTQWCLDRGGVDAVYRAAEFGADAIQIDAGEPGVTPMLSDASAQQAYLHAARETGVQITGICPNLLNVDGMCNPQGTLKADRCWDAVVRALDGAIEMGVPLVYLPSFNDGEIRNNDDLLHTAAVLQRACVHLAGHGVSVATENTLGVDGHHRLIAATAHPDLRILIDSLNPVYWGVTPADLLRAFWPIVCDQVHAKDGVNKVMGNALLGAGEAGFTQTAATLIELGFAGYAFLENACASNFEDSLRADMATLRRVLG